MKKAALHKLSKGKSALIQVADNGMRIGVARQCLAGGPLERFKLGQDAKLKMIQSVAVSTSSFGRRALHNPVKLDPKTMTVKQKNRLKKTAAQKQLIAKRRSERKEAKRARKRAQKSSRV